jgi:hypothetical protein
MMDWTEYALIICALGVVAVNVKAYLRRRRARKILPLHKP